MGTLRKRLKEYIATVFVLYTILVTYFLAQRAWDDVSTRLRRRTDVRMLDVLVQEEDRHMRSFQDVVNNYREDGFDSNVHKFQRRFVDTDYKYQNKSNEYLSNEDKRQIIIDSITNAPNLNGGDNEPYNDTDIPKDLMVRLEEEAEENKVPRPVFQVEVEEWDTNPSPEKPLLKTSFHSDHNSSFDIQDAQNAPHNFHIDLNSSNIEKGYNQNSIYKQPSNKIFVQGNYTTLFCDKVFGETAQRPAICDRELVEFSSKMHINVSKYSLQFRELGDIFVFSAFLDTREKSYMVRVMTLGPQGRDKSRSTYWCVFFLAPNGTAGGLQYSSRLATQLTYFSASDGHRKSNQFYIMTCQVPEAAKSWLLTLRRGVIEIVTGDLQRPFADKFQERLTARIIRNCFQCYVPEWKDFSQRRSYFDKMEHDLLTLNVSGHRVTKSSIYTINNSSISNNVHYNKDMVNGDINRNNVQEHFLTNNSNDRIVTCVAPLQGNIAVVQLVEFIELTLLLGSQHIVFYTFRINSEIKSALSMYEWRGLVTVLNWNLPSPESVWANGRDMALNDCLYRTMFVYDYALFLDLDEFLVPRITSDIPSFLKYLKTVHRFNTTRFSDLVFSSAYFPPPSKLQYKNLTAVVDFTRDINKFVSLKSVYRTYFNPRHTIRLVKLAMAFRVGAGERKRTSFTVSSRFAVVNHYSYCPQGASVVKNVESDGQFDNGKPGAVEKSVHDICSHMKQDFIMWRYKNVLVQRVRDSVRRLNKG